MFNFFLSLVFGIIVGCVAGLLPGLHTNNLLPIVFSLSLLGGENGVIFISSMVASQLIFNFLIATFFGAADDEANSLASLPSHRLLIKGEGMKSVVSLIYGSLLGFLFSIVLLVIFFNYIKPIYTYSRSIIVFVIIFVVSYLILLEREIGKIFKSFLIFIISGIFGILVLNGLNIPEESKLLPCFTGLFGISSLLTSIYTKTKLQKQKTDFNLGLNKINILKASFAGSIAGFLVGLLPGIGVAQGIILVSSFFKISNPVGFLLVQGSVASSDNIFSTAAVYLIGNPRSGASVYLERIVDKLEIKHLFLVLFSFGISLALSSFFVFKLSPLVFKLIEKIDYKTVNISVISFLVFIVFIFSGFIGLYLLFIATLIGFLNIKFNVNRSFSMGFLILPTILFFFNYFYI
ncbi:MAG: tripartite tricarboxylate transporter permease [Candidatus Aenigmatarchaeota archaeon]